jgi:hypothetical protein
MGEIRIFSHLIDVHRPPQDNQARCGGQIEMLDGCGVEIDIMKFDAHVAKQRLDRAGRLVGNMP